MLPDRINEDIDFELGEIDILFELYQQELLDLEQSPKLVELTALASVLHSFYNGVEKILLIIAKSIDKKIPSDLNWHRSLLEQMAKENDQRKAVLTHDLKNELLKYLGFRHFFRHSYSFHLKWERMEELVKPLRNAHYWKNGVELAFDNSNALVVSDSSIILIGIIPKSINRR